ncbi:hypothetical protein BYT27DRAFT_7187677 [Phlegmacium glaucopus]|nr:hypothetical protein BYT27DRAFT_7187677 [Phlegmacium glaucopus]
MPTLLYQTFLNPIGLFNEDEDNCRSVLPTSIARMADEIDKARRRILVLEAELEKSNKAAAMSSQKLSKEELRNLDLERRIEGLELALELERKKVHEKDIQSVETHIQIGFHCQPQGSKSTLAVNFGFGKILKRVISKADVGIPQWSSLQEKFCYSIETWPIIWDQNLPL